MASDFNTLTISGMITSDIQRFTTQSGTDIYSFTIVSNLYKKKGEKIEQTGTFLKAIFFGYKGEAIYKNLNKGDKILIKGRLQQNSWEKDGVKHYSYEVVGDEFLTIGKKISSDDNFKEASEHFEAPTPDY